MTLVTEGFDFNVEWSPFVRDGLVGFKCTRVSDGAKTYIYMNPSTSGDGLPDVFIYQGPSGMPENDGAECFITPTFESP